MLFSRSSPDHRWLTKGSAQWPSIVNHSLIFPYWNGTSLCLINPSPHLDHHNRPRSAFSKSRNMQERSSLDSRQDRRHWPFFICRIFILILLTSQAHWPRVQNHFAAEPINRVSLSCWGLNREYVSFLLFEQRQIRLEPGSGRVIYCFW